MTNLTTKPELRVFPLIFFQKFGNGTFNDACEKWICWSSPLCNLYKSNGGLFSLQKINYGREFCYKKTTATVIKPAVPLTKIDKACVTLLNLFLTGEIYLKRCWKFIWNFCLCESPHALQIVGENYSYFPPHLQKFSVNVWIWWLRYVYSPVRYLFLVFRYYAHSRDLRYCAFRCFTR